MESPVATILDGKIKGLRQTDYQGGEFYSFLGIPYAKPPIGKLRFKAPEPAEPWTGVKDATKTGEKCFQRDQSKGFIGGSEDCLHLNVFTKKLPSEETKLKPVMVWIHGGAFKNGSNDPEFFGPEYLITEDVVLVTINYRLGLLGFLHFTEPDLEVYGNAGLKDQQLALKWVQRNIKFFNGDPENVTVFGNSAGSISVHYLVLSPTSKGLFHKAIMQSGAVLNSWSEAKYTAMELLGPIFPEFESEKEMLNKLRKLPVEELFELQEKILLIHKGSSRITAPNVEKPNPTAIVTTKASKLLISGQYEKIPIMLGYCDREGMLFEVYKRAYLATGKPLPPNFNTVNLHDFIHPDQKLSADDPKQDIIKKKLKGLYFDGDELADKHLITSDSYFITGIVGSAKLHAKHSLAPVYLYRMSLDAELNLLKKLTKITDPGVCHGDELGYLFKTILLDGNVGDVESTAIRRFVKLWTNFAKYGNATPEGNDLNINWKPVTKNDVNFLDIGTELLVDKDPEEDRMKVWKEIYQLTPSTENYL